MLGVLLVLQLLVHATMSCARTSAFAVLIATLFNLITDLVGGMRFTVLEEEVVETRTSPMRRFVVRRTEPEVPAVIRDSSGAMVREAVVDDTGANARPSR